jgi:hypothetical protein
MTAPSADSLRGPEKGTRPVFACFSHMVVLTWRDNGQAALGAWLVGRLLKMGLQRQKETRPCMIPPWEDSSNGIPEDSPSAA